MTERGFVQLPALAWGAIGAGLIILSLGIALKVQSVRLESCKAEYAAFVAQVKALGEEAEREAKAKETADLKAKENADAANQKLRTDNAALARRLRDARRTSGGALSGIPATAKRPDLTCFSRSDYERAFEQFDQGLSQFAEICDQRTIDLDTAKTWMKEIQSSPR